MAAPTPPPVSAAAAAPRPPGEIRRARPLYRVFVSSTWIDLQPERRALMEALHRMEEMRFVGMEFFGNRPEDTHEASLDQVGGCEVFVLIVGDRYGSGITQAEYWRARELGLPCFVYFKTAAPGASGIAEEAHAREKFAAFRRDLLRDHTVKEFAHPEVLAASATADLHNWVAARWITLERAVTPPRSAAGDAERTNLSRLMDRVEQDWIAGVLEASLHHRARVELDLEWRDGAVEHPWDRIVVAPGRPIAPLPAADRVAEVFAAAQQTLLVLGEPGAGKTTTLLELARDLLARARESALEPPPIVLALTTWPGTATDFAAWLVTELGLRYQVPRRLAQAWLDDARLVLLLDGLDEVPAARRAACVEAINAFEQSHHPPGLAVTCRVAEYDALPVKLRLRSAICLQPLTPEQVERYLTSAGPRLAPLARTLRTDAGLRELARTPLMLSVMTMAWADAAGDAVTVDGVTPEARRRQLFAAYVDAAMRRKGKAAAPHPPEKINGALSWLARKMSRQGQTLFALEQLQPDWLDGIGPAALYFFSTRVLAALALAVPWWIVLALITTTERPAHDGRPVWSMAATAIGSIALELGLFSAVVDFLLARIPPLRLNLGRVRFIVILFGLVMVAGSWASRRTAASPGSSTPAVIGSFYAIAYAFAFGSMLDVRHRDVVPTATMRWSWRLAFDRLGLYLVGINLVVGLLTSILLGFTAAHEGWPKALGEFAVNARMGAGALGGAGVALALWAWLRPPWSSAWPLIGLALLVFGAQIGATFNPNPAGRWGLLLAEFLLAEFFAIFSGLAPGMIDPARTPRAGFWFWLRVPALAFVVMSLIASLPPLIVYLLVRQNNAVTVTSTELAPVVAFVIAASSAAFFRFGGSSGLQHLILRIILVRQGHLPRRADSFFTDLAQMALLQKVGFGYRFVHALLLDYFAGK